MFQLIDNAVSSIAAREQLSFEQPLTERMRTFLRLEFLYEQTRFHLDGIADYSARATVSGLLEMLAILGRGDVRAEVLKELERQSERLSQFRRNPDVDTDRLDAFVRNLDGLKAQLAAIGTQYLQSLKDCDFLSAIKHRSSIPGGTCTFDVPDYAYWLASSVDDRERQLSQWLRALSPLCDAVAELLWLTREAAEPERCIADAGFYQHSLDRNTQLNLIRVRIPQSAGVYPEISAGKHRFTVRFIQWRGVDERPAQTSKNISFDLMLS